MTTYVNTIIGYTALLSNRILHCLTAKHENPQRIGNTISGAVNFNVKMWHILVADPACLHIGGRRVYVGGATHAADARTLARLGITLVINCAVDLPRLAPPTIDYVHLPLTDAADSSLEDVANWDEAATMIADTPGNVMFHCVMGSSRSVASLLRLLTPEATRCTLQRGNAWRQLYHRICVVRPSADLNENFAGDLDRLFSDEPATETADSATECADKATTECIDEGE